MPIVSMPDSTQVQFPDDMPPAQIKSLIQQKFPQAGAAPESSISDFVKSMPRGIVSNIASAASFPAEGPAPPPDALLASQADKQAALDKAFNLHQPQTTAGKFGEAIGSGLGNPLSYIGPGSLPLKIGGAILASTGSEAAGQATEGTPLETPARLLGGLAGGAAAVKGLGASAEKAAIPTASELKTAAETGYNAARNSNLVLNQSGVSQWAAGTERELTNGPKYGFTGGQDGTAPKTIAALGKLQSPPGGAVVTGANLDTLRANLGDIAGETRLTGSGPMPTPDAKAAMVALKRLQTYTENIPPNHVMAGDPQSYVNSIKEANANYAASKRAGTVEQKTSNAVDNYEGSIAGRLDQQIKSQVAKPLLRNQKAQRGYTQDEINAARDLNKGSITSSTLSQLGRGGAGVVPLIAHIALGAGPAVATGGASLIPQTALAAALYGARKGAERMTLAQANKFRDMLAMRSPLYQQRANAIPPVDLSGNKAALVRGLLSGVF